ncbi:fluoride efflux transporter CrcB [Saccharothrix australiensis]|uniref:Fluoride-specific ion channel FluC n=1 Tax=Saccharothrix australiensis TaxID=2072 RepID=A0A495VV36_9PSEU|nr:fluoride efflux transporter CrcB [Saccharothrix australiensis]RKT53222.1 camphor resistance protein CrcB [Saccharothrix australiensis]
MTVLLVFAGSALGAVARYLTDRFVRGRTRATFPWGTLAVNVVGSLLLGCVAGADPAWAASVGTGFCGGLSTYSTFSHETVRLLEDGRHGQALVNVAANLGAGVAAAAVGCLLTR